MISIPTSTLTSILPSIIEPACYELRQAVEVAAPVLQEGHHEEDRAVPASSLPVLPPLPRVEDQPYRTALYRTVQYSTVPRRQPQQIYSHCAFHVDPTAVAIGRNLPSR